MHECYERFRRKAQDRFEQSLEYEWSKFLTCYNIDDKKGIIKRLIYEQQGRCNSCNNYTWMGTLIPLELEHKDGNHSNDSRDNLELLCPNCHALTSTWKGKNKNCTGKHLKKISDEDFLTVLKQSRSIRSALIKLNLAETGGNYERAKKLLNI